MNSIFEELVKSIADIPTTVKSITTHCFHLSHKVFKRSTPNFERVDSHYEVDGLLVTYKCKLDGRDYFVKITAQKDKEN